jgi:hypothetical protein
MSGDHAVATRSRQFLFDRPVTGREDEAVDAGHPAVNDREAAAVDVEPELSRQRAHPATALGVHVPVGVGILLLRQDRAGTILGEAATAIRRLSGERFLAVTRDYPDTRTP